MIFWGSGREIVHLGWLPPAHCCNTERPFSFVLQYDFGHLYFLFGYVKHREYLRICDCCGQTQLLETAAVEYDLGHVPIPFMRRFGCLVLIVLVFVVMIWELLGQSSGP